VIVWIRCILHTFFSSLVLFPMRGMALLRTRHFRWHVLRAIIFLSVTASTFWTLQVLQLPVVTAIFFSTPLIIAVLSTRLLGEKLDARGWIAIAAGFGGVLVVVSPGTDEFHPAMLVCILNSLGNAVSALLMRRLAAYDTTETIQYLPALIATVALAPFAFVITEWPQGWHEWSIACLLGVLGALAHYFLALAHRYASAMVIAPFTYPQVIYAAVFGYLVFGDVPQARFWVGATIVVAAGLYLYRRERDRL
jgi:drug/metabolite transporter (DMT)-like permease